MMSKANFVGILAVALAWLTPMQAVAHDIPINTGLGLLANCTYQSDDRAEIEFHAGLCIGFLKGVGNAWSINNEAKWCIEGPFNNGVLIETVVSRLRLLPASMLESPSAPMVISAMEAAYPCQKR